MDVNWLGVAILGIGVGIGSSFLGIGGGLLLVPLLPHVTSMSHKEALATSLMTIFLVTVRNTWGFQRRSLVPWRPWVGLSLGAGTFASATGYLAAQAPVRVLEVLFFCLLLGLIVFLSVGHEGGKSDPKLTHPVPRAGWGLVGAGAGVLSGSTGVGAGLVVTPLLMRLKWVPAEQIVPLVNGLMVITSGFGALGYSLKTINFGVMGLVWISAQISSYFGVRFQERMSGSLRRNLLRVTIAVLIVVKGVDLWWI